MKRGVIYARYSTDKQRELSIETQISVCRKFAKENNIKIVKNYIDRGISGTTDERPSFQKMIADSKNDMFDYVIVYKSDRFARNNYYAVVYEHELEENGVRLLSATEPINDEDSSLIMKNIFRAFNQEFISTLKKRINYAFEKKVEKGEVISGKVPLGYKIENKKMVIDKKTAPLAQLIFKMYATGKSSSEIRDYLDKKGIRSKLGNKISRNSILQIIGNEKYTGMFKYNGNEYPNYYPALISKEMFQICKEKRAFFREAGATNKTDRVYLLRGKLFCMHCGTKMYPTNASYVNKKNEKITFFYYNCKDSKKDFGNACSRKSVRMDLVDKIVINTIKNNLLGKQLKNTLEQIKRFYRTTPDKKELNALQEKLSLIDVEINNIINAIKSGIDSVALKEELIRLEKEKKEITINLEILKKESTPIIDEDAFYFWADQFKESKLSKKEERELVEIFIDKIIVGDKSLLIAYNINKNKTKVPINQMQDFLESHINQMDNVQYQKKIINGYLMEFLPF